MKKLISIIAALSAVTMLPINALADNELRQYTADDYRYVVEEDWYRPETENYYKALKIDAADLAAITNFHSNAYSPDRYFDCQVRIESYEGGFDGPVIKSAFGTSDNCSKNYYCSAVYDEAPPYISLYGSRSDVHAAMVAVKPLLPEIDPDLDVYEYNDHSEIICVARYAYGDDAPKIIDVTMAKKIYSALSEFIENGSVDFAYQRIVTDYGVALYGEIPIDIQYYDETEIEEVKEKIDDFFKSRGVEYTIRDPEFPSDAKSRLVIDVGEDVPYYEKFMLLRDLCVEKGLRGRSSYGFENMPPYKQVRIDMTKDSVDGDANTDGELSISDAVAVMQSVVNNDKYKLTAQGAFNADINGDGITPLDAQKIQMKLLDLE